MKKHFKQLIIARRDLNMSPGKLAAQVSHASSAFLIEKAKDLGLIEGIDYFPIVDACRTELIQGTLFRPMEAEKIGKDFHLY